MQKVESPKSPISEIAKSLGQRGGRQTLKRYGKKHFTNLNVARWAKQKTDSKPAC